MSALLFAGPDLVEHGVILLDVDGEHPNRPPKIVMLIDAVSQIEEPDMADDGPALHGDFSNISRSVKGLCCLAHVMASRCSSLVRVASSIRRAWWTRGLSHISCQSRP